MSRIRRGGHLGLGVAAFLVLVGVALCIAGMAGLRRDEVAPPPQPSSSVLTQRDAAGGAAARGDAGRVRALPPSAPTRIDVAAIGVHAPVVSLGLQRDGTIAVPPLSKAQETSWYKYGPTPGEDGPAVIVGHVDSKSGPAVFYRLGEIKPGAKVQISREDGTRPVFQVYRLERVPKTNFPTKRVYGPARHPALRLITCGGAYSSATGHYLDNIIAYATRVS
jgi:hypothetical protein